MKPLNEASGRGLWRPVRIDCLKKWLQLLALDMEWWRDREFVPSQIAGVRAKEREARDRD